MTAELSELEYKLEYLQKENDQLIEKLADIRSLFDESDQEAEGHGMDDMIASPYAVLCYAENKLKRLIEINTLYESNNKRLISQVSKLTKENNYIYGRLNMISDIVENGRKEIGRLGE